MANLNWENYEQFRIRRRIILEKFLDYERCNFWAGSSNIKTAHRFLTIKEISEHPEGSTEL